MPKIVIGGDVCPVGRNKVLFKKGEASLIFNDLLEIFDSADFSIVNLECPLIENKSPIKKNGPILGVESACVNGLKNAGINAVTIANNHIMDHGANGLRNTIKVCRKAGIQTVGAGENSYEASKILFHSIKNKKIGIIGIAENEFSIADKHSPGANPFDLFKIAYDIKANKKNIDYLIVLYHGGKELYELPSPQLKKVCRFMIETGADTVVVQHTHCPGTAEKYMKGHIVYGQGNLIFDKKNTTLPFKQGFLVKLTILEENIHSEIEILPYIQSDSLPGARRMKEKKADFFIKAIQERSKQILQDDFIEENWIKFCEKKKRVYFNRVLGSNRLIKKLNSYKWFRNVFYGDDFILRLQNTISCESHREVLLTLFRKNMW